MWKILGVTKTAMPHQIFVSYHLKQGVFTRNMLIGIKSWLLKCVKRFVLKNSTTNMLEFNIWCNVGVEMMNLLLTFGFQIQLVISDAAGTKHRCVVLVVAVTSTERTQQVHEMKDQILSHKTWIWIWELVWIIRPSVEVPQNLSCRWITTPFGGAYNGPNSKILVPNSFYFYLPILWTHPFSQKDPKHWVKRGRILQNIRF